jgi:hypothetical protein
MKTIKYIPLLIMITSVFSCTYTKWEVKPQAAVVCDTNRTITYSGDIAPFITSTCGGTNINCHSSAASSMVPLDVYVGVQYFGQTGQIMNSVNWTAGASQMPKNSGKLSACDIAMLQKWVNEGEPNN